MSPQSRLSEGIFGPLSQQAFVFLVKMPCFSFAASLLLHAPVWVFFQMTSTLSLHEF